MFFSGSLQEGIALAVQEAKAVICFVQDDSETSTTWEGEYFAGDKDFTQMLESRAVLLRIPKDSPEAGFLTSVCPITQYPTVVVIRNGMLREYIVPDISKEEFRRRLTAILDDAKPQDQAQTQTQTQTDTQTQTQVAAPSTGQRAGPATAQASLPVIRAPPPAASAARTSPTPERSRQYVVRKKKATDEGTSTAQRSTSAQAPPRPKDEQKQEPQPSKTEKSSDPSPSTRAKPPTQYRLQVRLFDGRSVRSTFTPTQTIRTDVRPWLDSQMADEKRPYSLKLILTPSPNRTLTVAEEELPLQELISGSTATFVVIPIKSYIEAYSESGSLPARAVSSIYGSLSSVTSTATGLVGWLFGYGGSAPAQAESEQPQSESQPSDNSSTARRRPFGPNIRTLRDQNGEQDRSQFYNGNQLNFEPRRDDR